VAGRRRTLRRRRRLHRTRRPRPQRRRPRPSPRAEAARRDDQSAAEPAAPGPGRARRDTVTRPTTQTHQQRKERATSHTLTDSTGAEVTVTLDEDSRSYVIAVEGGAIAGHAYFPPGPAAETERIFHHTVVDEQFGGRGLSKVLVAEALADSRERGITV